MSRWRASSSVLLALLPALLAVVVLAQSEPVSLRPVACFDESRVVLGNGTVLALPTLERLADIGPVDGCDIGGEVLAAWRAGRVTVYRNLRPAFTATGERAFAGSRFVLVVSHDFVAVYSVHGFEVFRLGRYTSPAAVWVLAAQRAGGKAVVLVSPTTCRARMQVESYLLVYDLDTGLYSIHQTGAVSFLAVPSGAVWVKNGTLYHNGRALGPAGSIHPVHGFDGYASVEEGKVVVHGLDGSRFELPMPQGRGLAVSRLQEGFVACTDAACACTFECSFSELAHQAFTPLSASETETHYLLHGGGWLFVVEKPRAEEGAGAEEGAEAAPSATPAEEAEEPPLEAEERSEPQPEGAQHPQEQGAQPEGAAPAAAEPEPLNATPEQPPSPLWDGEPPLWLPAAAAAVAAVAAAGYLLYRREYRYVA